MERWKRMLWVLHGDLLARASLNGSELRTLRGGGGGDGGAAERWIAGIGTADRACAATWTKAACQCAASSSIIVKEEKNLSLQIVHSRAFVFTLTRAIMPGQEQAGFYPDSTYMFSYSTVHKLCHRPAPALRSHRCVAVILSPLRRSP